MEFTFVKQSAVIKGPLQKQSSLGNGEEPKPQITSSPIEFVAMPSTVKVAANSNTILNVVAKLKNSYQLASIGKDSGKQRAEKYNHLLIAKIKDTQIMFSFIIEASVIESSGNANMS